MFSTLVLVVCPLEIVSCEYAEMGCGVRLPRSEMREHVRESSQDHLLKMCAANLSLSRELSHKVAEKEQQITELHRDMRHREEEMSSDTRCIEETMSSDMRRLEEKMSSDMRHMEEKMSSDMRRMEEKMKEVEGILKVMFEEGSKKEVEAIETISESTANMRQELSVKEDKMNNDMRRMEKRYRNR